jgi:nicotinate phosphoribosyltransferase
VVKLSEGKQTLPGAKQVYRRPGLSDTLCLRDEPPPAPDAEGLLVVVMERGRRTGEREPLSTARTRFEGDRDALADEQADLERPVVTEPVISSALAVSARQARRDARGRSGRDDGG